MCLNKGLEICRGKEPFGAWWLQGMTLIDWIFSRAKLLLGTAKALAAWVKGQCWALFAGSGVAIGVCHSLVQSTRFVCAGATPFQDREEGEMNLPQLCWSCAQCHWVLMSHVWRWLAGGSSGKGRGASHCLQVNQEQAGDMQTHEPSGVPLGALSPRPVPLQGASVLKGKSAFFCRCPDMVEPWGGGGQCHGCSLGPAQVTMNVYSVLCSTLMFKRSWLKWRHGRGRAFLF